MLAIRAVHVARLTMLVIVVVVVVVAVIVAAAAGVAVLMVMAVRLGIDEGCCELALNRDRHLARRLFVFNQQSHHFCADAQIIDGAEIVPAQTSLPIEDQHRRRALQLIGAHRLGQVLAVRLVERDRNGDVVFCKEGFDFFRRLLGEFLERMCSPNTATSFSSNARRSRIACGSPYFCEPGQVSCQIATTMTLPFSDLSERFLSELIQR